MIICERGLTYGETFARDARLIQSGAKRFEKNANPTMVCEEGLRLTYGETFGRDAEDVECAWAALNQLAGLSIRTAYDVGCQGLRRMEALSMYNMGSRRLRWMEARAANRG